VYEYDYYPARDGKATLELWDTDRADNAGAVTVTIERIWRG